MKGIERLEEQILDKRREISTEQMSMSIGELTSMFESGELVIRPSFQRLFRWSDMQKTRLIESLLLKIPIPSIFVATDEHGRWEVIDGLQRISTLLQLQGLLAEEVQLRDDGDGAAEGFRDNSTERVEPLVLEGTEYLPGLEGTSWDGYEGSAPLTPAQKRDILRSRIDLIIIDRGSDPRAKFDLFQRLNSLGTALTAQEIRNAMLHSVDPKVAEWVFELSKLDDFASVVSLNSTLQEQAYPQELVLRFLALHNEDVQRLSSSGYLSTVLDNFAIRLCEMDETDRQAYDQIFRRTFGYFSKAGNSDIFKIHRDGVVVDRFSVTSYEILAFGVGYWISREKFPSIPGNELFDQFLAGGFEMSSSGKSAEYRMKQTIPHGRNFVATYV